MTSTFIEIDLATGRQKRYAKRRIRNYIPLSVDEAIAALKSKKDTFAFYKSVDFDVDNVVFAITTHKAIPEIFVLKKYPKRDDRFYSEYNTMKTIQEMDEECQNLLVPSKSIVNKKIDWFIMEYFDGSITDLDRDLSDLEKETILKKITKAVKCLHDKGLYYTDMKTDQILYRFLDDDSLEIRLSDLETHRKGEDALITYKPPKNSRLVDKDGHFKYGSTDEAVNWGLTILAIQLFTDDNRNLRKAFRRYHKYPKEMLEALKGNISNKAYNLIEYMYAAWDSISSNEMFSKIERF